MRVKTKYTAFVPKNSVGKVASRNIGIRLKFTEEEHWLKWLQSVGKYWWIRNIT